MHEGSSSVSAWQLRNDKYAEHRGLLRLTMKTVITLPGTRTSQCRQAAGLCRRRTYRGGQLKQLVQEAAHQRRRDLAQEERHSLHAGNWGRVVG